MSPVRAVNSGSRPPSFSPGAERRRAPVLPDDGAVDGPAARPVPDHRRLALVGDADGGDLARRGAGLVERLAAGRERRLPQVLRLVLHPARGREVLRELALRHGGDGGVGPEEDGPRGGGALVDGENVGGQGMFPPVRLLAVRLLVVADASGRASPTPEPHPIRLKPTSTEWVLVAQAACLSRAAMKSSSAAASSRVRRRPSLERRHRTSSAVIAHSSPMR